MLGLLTVLVISLVPLSDGVPADLLILKYAPSEFPAAMCLDGSPPGYYFRPGYGSGASKWIVHLEGGGWCYNEDECVQRSKTVLGSSKEWKPTAEFAFGFLSDIKELNPDFYNWNLAFVNYCDGASFVGHVNDQIIHNGTEIYFKGFPILQVTFRSLLEDKGMGKADEVILTGCSAGGLATYLHADYVASVIPQSAKFRAMADAGYFLDAPNINGEMDIRAKSQYVFKMQNGTEGVNQKCIDAHNATNDTWKCLSAQYAEPFTSSNLFALNSIYDSWQLANILQLPCKPPDCDSRYMDAFEEYGKNFLKTAAGLMSRESRGYFFDSCIKHCQSLDVSWNKITVKGQNAATTFANWYFNRTGIKEEVDCAYPCNKSC